MKNVLANLFKKGSEVFIGPLTKSGLDKGMPEEGENPIEKATASVDHRVRKKRGDRAMDT